MIDHQTLTQIVRTIDSQYELVNAEPLAGGISARVYVLDVRTVDGQPRKLLLRQHGAADLALNPQIAANEFQLLDYLHTVGLPVPKPVLVDQSGELIPSPYIVLDYIEGTTEFSPEDRPAFIRRCAVTLADIHRKAQPVPPFLPDQARLCAEKLRYRPKTLDDSLDEGRIRAALESVWPLPQTNPQVLLHGDFWPGNLVWREGQLVAVIDWENAAGGDPLADLAISRLEMLWAFGAAAMEAFTQEYRALMSTVDFAHLPYWDLAAALRPTHNLAEWAAEWPTLGRPDVTEQSMQEAHRWFVAQAYEGL